MLTNGRNTITVAWRNNVLIAAANVKCVDLLKAKQMWRWKMLSNIYFVIWVCLCGYCCCGKWLLFGMTLPLRFYRFCITEVYICHRLDTDTLLSRCCWNTLNLNCGIQCSADSYQRAFLCCTLYFVRIFRTCVCINSFSFSCRKIKFFEFFIHFYHWFDS